ncbi:tRNA synthetases class II (D, K and n) domain-containing protein [Hirsutella rhossiliensis]|uniref:asparagine--tRNA ligase n=1 Tax=Hirsutella rhossiliensis TaxID=111463 RepID=A0A9P8N0H0_9HYPO|nr:tRNA synthetases class II (D, K and n) domain-containing protein [Hirsutella rhossiliensis]KAH0964637.1 tRNA synthetases class II (D, K and n) domain-containing protein [Hirsutella rhossiliensis]
MPPAPCRASRLLPWSPARRYSVRIPGESHPSIKTVADLRAWSPQANVPDVEVCGWVRSVRKSSGVRFVDITDGSSMRPVQAVVDKKQSSDLRLGAAVRLRGTWYNAKNLPGSEANVSNAPSSEPGEPTSHASNNHAVPPDPETSQPMHELQVNHVEVLASSDPETYPIQNKYQTPESLRAVTHLRSRTPVNATLLRLRSDAMAALTRFFSQEKFQQTHPPIITSSDCEGAGEAFAVGAGGRADFFRDPKYLTVSTQLHLEALAQALGNVWTLSPTFRAEKSDTSRHLSEFYMLEAEMSFVQDMNQVMDLVQSMMAFLAGELKQLDAAKELDKNRLDSRDPAENLALADLVDPEELGRRWRGLLLPRKWPRITYTEAVERLQPAAGQFEHEPIWGRGLQSEHEKYLAEQIGYDKAEDAYVPVFVTHFPQEIKAFYMIRSDSRPSHGETVDCFDLLVPSLGELAGGSMREHRLSQLEDNMRLQGLPVPSRRKATGNDMTWYLDLRRWGCPPHGGFGLGFDRLLSYLTGVPNVRDVVPFPRHFGRCDC